MKKKRFAAAVLAMIILIGAPACSTHSDTQPPNSASGAASEYQGSDTSEIIGSSGKSENSSAGKPGSSGSPGSSTAISGTGSSGKAGTSSAGRTGNSRSPGGPGTTGTGSSGKTGSSSAGRAGSTGASSGGSGTSGKPVSSKPTSSATASKPASTKPASSKPESEPSGSSSKPASSSKPKTAYDKPYDIDQIRADMIAYGKSRGMTYTPSLYVKNVPPDYPSNGGYHFPLDTRTDIVDGQNFKQYCRDDLDYLLEEAAIYEPKAKPSDIGFNAVLLPLAGFPGDYFVFVVYG